MLALNYVHHGEARLVCEAHEEWGRSFQALHPQLPALGLSDVDATEGRPLVVSVLDISSYTAEWVCIGSRPCAHTG